MTCGEKNTWSHHDDHDVGDDSDDCHAIAMKPDMGDGGQSVTTIDVEWVATANIVALLMMVCDGGHHHG